MWDFLLSILDYIILFVIITLGSFIGVTFAILVAAATILKSFAQRAGYSYQKGRNEYVNEQEKKYSRRTV